MQTLPGIRFVDLTTDRARLAADIAIACRLRGADAVYVAVAQEHGTTRVTWDQELLTRSGSQRNDARRVAGDEPNLG